VLALELEKKLTKDQILERYLNEVYFGQGAYGVQAASERYFQHPVDSLNVAEAAFLAGMIRNPVGYDPTRFRERSRARRSVVLDRMVAVGQITRDDAAQLKRSAMPRPADRLAKPDTYFIEAVKQELLNDVRLGRTAKDRYEAVFNGGLRILTTFDPVAQQAAEKAVADVVPTDEPDFTAAVASVDVASGAVRAMVGGRGFETDKYNLVTQGLRQPGSSWKPIVFLAALEQGISPLSYLSGKEPCPIPNPGGLPDPFEPKNAGDATGKVAGLSDQLVASSNCAFARLAYIVGYQNIIDTARRLGITTRIDAVPAMALGVEEVHPLELAGVYATIAAGGIKRTPFLVREVRGRDGKSLYRTKISRQRVADANFTSVVTDAMTQVVERGTGTAAQLPGRVVAGKTGTTNNYEDAWFVGFTPQLATAVWMGSPRAKISMSDVGGIKVFGGTYPAQIWHEYTASILATEPILAFPAADYTAFPKADCLTIVDEPKSASAGSKSASKSANRSSKKSVKRKAKSTKAVATPVPADGQPDPVPVADPAPAPAPAFVGGRGFSVQVPSVGPTLPSVSFKIPGTAGPDLPRSSLTQGTRCQDRFSGTSSAKKRKKAKKVASVDSSPAPIQVANTAAPVADQPEPAPTPEPVVVATPPADPPQ
jgi:membrane peptidoglycan carboxypeptidase